MMSKTTSDRRATERKHPWPMVWLGDVCEVQRGGSPRPIKDYLTDSPEGLNWIKIGDVEPAGKYITQTAEKIKTSGLNKTRKVSAGDFLLSNSMSFGRPYILKIDGCIHDGWLVLKGFSKTFTEDFFYYLLRSPIVQEQFDKLAHGSTVRNLNTDVVSRVSLPLPPLPVQREIVARLERELAAVEKMKKGFEALAETAKAEFKAELKEVFEGLKSGETGIGTDGTNGTVETRRLGEICENLDCRRVPITKSDREVGKYPYYGASGIVDWVSGYIFDGDYLLVSEDGANLIARSTPIAFSVSGKIWVNNHAHILLFPDLATQRFVEFYFASIKIDDFVTGAAQPKLTQNALNSIAIPLPSLTVQREVVARLDLAKARAEKLETKAREGVAVCETMRKAILKEAFAPCGAGEVS